MKDELKKKDNEALYDWVERIAPQCVGMNAAELAEAMHEVCLTGYVMGTNVMYEARGGKE